MKVVEGVEVDDDSWVPVAATTIKNTYRNQCIINFSAYATTGKVRYIQLRRQTLRKCVSDN